MITQENIPYTADEIKAMVKTNKELRKKYNEALERARDLMTNQNPPAFDKHLIETVFPELQESEDDKIRKVLLNDFKNNCSEYYCEGVNRDMIIAWLEKQGKSNSQTVLTIPKFTFNDVLALQCCMETVKKVQEDKELYEKLKDLHSKVYDGYQLEKQGDKKNTCKRKIDDAYLQGICDAKHAIEKQGEQSTDKVEPKFKAGDWIVDDKTPNDVFCVIEVLEEIYKVIDIDGEDYHIPHCKADKQFHLWTIQDAKDGDVLAEDSCIFIIQKLGDNNTAKTYCILHDDGDFNYDSILYLHFYIDSTKPATKEQRDLLFQKMKNAGYEWDADKKELKKMEVESNENERIKQGLIEYFRSQEILYDKVIGSITTKEVLSWLEKQGEKLNPDKVIEWIYKYWPFSWGNFTLQVDDAIDKFKQDFDL